MTTRNLLSRLSSVDWDFAGSYSESLFSAIHFHPSRFASQVPATLVGLLSKPGDLVLDPFAGSGTTLVEAQRLDRRSLGIDLNPIAVLGAKAKLISQQAARLASIIGILKEEADSHVGPQMSAFGRRLRPTAPLTVQIQKWYTPRVAEDLSLLWSFIQSLEGHGKTIAEAAFSAILLSVCRETRHWGYVCDNTMPKGDHAGDVRGEFLRVLERLERAYQDRDAEIAARGGSTKAVREATVLEGDAAQVLSAYPRSTVDLVVTSPPYFGVCDYIKAQRLSMEWFGIDLERLRLQEIGARSKRHRGQASIEYVHGLHAVFEATRRCLKRSGYMAVVIGESARREEVLSDLRGIFKDLGFGLKLEINRRVSTQRRLAPSIMGEHLFILSR